MDERLEKVNLIDELDFTFVDVETQLIKDQEFWGDTWKERGLVWEDKPQEERFYETITKYMTRYRDEGIPIPWTKVIGEAHIALVRQKKLIE